MLTSRRANVHGVRLISNIRLWNVRCFADATVELGDISVLVGQNNSGKSTILRSLAAIQSGTQFSRDDRRIGSENGSYIRLWFTEKGAQVARGVPSLVPKGIPESAVIDLYNNGTNVTAIRAVDAEDRTVSDSFCFPGDEPHNIAFPFFSRRKPFSFNGQLTDRSTRAVDPFYGNLVDKVARATTQGRPASERYQRACRDILGFTVVAYSGEHGVSAGVAVGDYDQIPLQRMGEGVTQLAVLLSMLCFASDKVILLEEPENDLHPRALKRFMDLVVEAAEQNQVVVSTHSHIVAKHLCSVERSRLLSVEQEIRVPVPLSHVRIMEGVSERNEIMRELGYELSDFDLFEGWILFEEATAETFVSKLLIPMFAPNLANKVRTVSAAGASRVPVFFEELRRMVLFSYLDAARRNRCLVIVDGDAAGREVHELLGERFPRMPRETFALLSYPNLESYYPSVFDGERETLFQLPKKDRRSAKVALLERVLAWAKEEPVSAKDELSLAAREIIELLRAFEAQLFAD